MKKKIGVLIALLLIVAVIVCVIVLRGKDEQKDEALDLLGRIQQKGELTVATEGNWAPWTFHDEETNDLIGFDVEVATLIAEKLGVKATFVECPWESIFAGIDSERYDIAANGVEITDERAEKYDFSTPYGYIRTALVVHKDNEDIKSFEDLAGKSTVNSIASTYMTLAESYGATATGVSTLDMTIENVLYGRADATLNAEVSIYDYLSVHPDAEIKIVALTDEASQVSIPVRKGDDSASFLEAVNKVIDELAAEGKLAELSVKYFGSDITSPTTK